jgi:ribosomal subunit interface protein
LKEDYEIENKDEENIRGKTMKIKISGHHVEITEGIKQSIENKFAKISKHYPSIMAINSTITVEPHLQKLEVTTLYEGEQVTVNASDKQLYVAIAKVAKKLQSALAHRKGILSAKINNKFEVPQTDLYQSA